MESKMSEKIVVSFGLLLLLGRCGSPAAAAEPRSRTTYVWKDATGAIVEGASGALFGTSYFDSSGYVWNLDVVHSTLAPAVSLDSGAPYLVYESADCTGTAYYSLIPAPRITFAKIGGIFVRKDASADRVITACSRDIGVCQPDPLCAQRQPTDVLSTTETIGPLSIPMLPYTAPLHPELVAE